MQVNISILQASIQSNVAKGHIPVHHPTPPYICSYSNLLNTSCHPLQCERHWAGKQYTMHCSRGTVHQAGTFPLKVLLCMPAEVCLQMTSRLVQPFLHSLPMRRTHRLIFLLLQYSAIRSAGFKHDVLRLHLYLSLASVPHNHLLPTYVTSASSFFLF